MEDRGQTVTLEALVAALLLFAAVGFALTAVAITANTASVGDTELRNQHAEIGQGVLDAAVANGSLEAAILSWDEEGQRFHGTIPDNPDGTDIEPFHVGDPGNTTFGEKMEVMLWDQNRQFNVDLTFENENGELETQRLIEMGTPNEDAVRVSRTVTLYDDTPLVDEQGEARNTTLAEASDEFYAPNLDDEREIYNVIRVEVVIW